MGSLTTFFQGHENGIACIETAYRNGLALVSREGSVKIIKRKPEIEGYDKTQAELVTKMMRSEKESIDTIVKKPEYIRAALCKASKKLYEENEEFLSNLDLLDRLERVYRLLNPDMKGCINGESGCPDHVLMNCSACSGDNNAKT